MKILAYMLFIFLIIGLVACSESGPESSGQSGNMNIEVNNEPGNTEDEPAEEPTKPKTGGGPPLPPIDPEKGCGKEGGMISLAEDSEYPSICCPGLTANLEDTKVSVAGMCYGLDVDHVSEHGICIYCGNRVCDDIEDTCSCPMDCTEPEDSDYTTAEELCNSQEYAQILSRMCGGDTEYELCSLCLLE
ncbi:MAG: hypothetical protein KKG59_01605 [Nanoarchaeota archaeon]|nr:hypothetical protein [Nanoarchaeota archaeon]